MTRAEWEAQVLAPALAKSPERRALFQTASGHSMPVVLTPDDLTDIDAAREVAEPGTFPFTRGIHRTGYDGHPWTIGASAGLGDVADTNARFRHLLAAGATGLRVTVDRPTRLGRDPDHPLAAGEVGRGGVSVATVDDMLALFDGIDLGAVSVSLPGGGSAPGLLALFLVAAERRGVAWASLTGTLRSDVLEQVIARKDVTCPLRPAMRLVTDAVSFCHARVPGWDPVLISGAAIGEAGATVRQELAFTMAAGIAYLTEAVRAGLDVDEVAARLSFCFVVRRDFFEEIAKVRAARQVWARVVRERFGARADRACAMRLHMQTSRATLTALEPWANVVRTTTQALSAVLGGTNSLHVSAFDAVGGPRSADAAVLALRAQQVLLHECGLAGDVDPFGGSYVVERLTKDLADQAMADIEAIDRLGGMVWAVEQGVPQRQLAGGASGARDAGPVVPAADHDEAFAVRRVAHVQAARQAREPAAVAAALDGLRQAARRRANTMDHFIVCARSGVTVGEMCGVLRAEWGDTESVAN